MLYREVWFFPKLSHMFVRITVSAVNTNYLRDITLFLYLGSCSSNIEIDATKLNASNDAVSACSL